MHWPAADSLPDSVANLYDNWITIRPDSGYMFAFETRNLFLRIGEIGDHLPDEHGELVINSNDLANPQIRIPLTLSWLGVNEDSRALPSSFEIISVYPNPFNGRTIISLDLDHPGHLDVAIFDLSGRRIATIASGIFGAGQQSLAWNATAIPAGVYFVKAKSVSGVRTSRVVLTR
jgi:hypothetical protein